MYDVPLRTRNRRRDRGRDRRARGFDRAVVLSLVDGARVVITDLDVAASDEVVVKVSERGGVLFWLTASKIACEFIANYVVLAQTPLD